MILDIKIRKAWPDAKCDYYVFCGEDKLFQFRETEEDGRRAWYFWTRWTNSPEVFRGNFPMAYFTDLCKAKYFILAGAKTMPEGIIISEGKSCIHKSAKSKMRLTLGESQVLAVEDYLFETYPHLHVENTAYRAGIGEAGWEMLYDARYEADIRKALSKWIEPREK